MKRVLIIQTAFIGDVVLATSMAEILAKYRPEWKVDFLVRKGSESLLANNPLIDKVYVWDKNHKVANLFRIIKQVRKQDYYAVVNIQRFLNSGIATMLSKAKFKIGFKQNPASTFFTHKINHMIPHNTSDGYLHETQRNAQLLSPIIDELNVTDAFPPKLYFNKEIEDKVKAIALEHPNYIVLAPTSVWFTKQWSMHKWSELAKVLAPNYSLLFIGAPADRDAIESIIENTPNCINLAGKLSLLESARLMKDARRVFVNDSAPLHLASSVDARTTAIFCSTVPEFGYTPLSSNSKVITTQKRLECQPCGLHGKKACPLGHFECSNLISVEEVASTVR